MSIFSVEVSKLSSIVEALSELVIFDNDLPMKVFNGKEFDYWFFERPLICYLDMMEGLIKESLTGFESDVFVKFSGDRVFSGSCFFFEKDNFEAGVKWLSEGFKNFFGGTVGYPIVIFNGDLDWVAYESSREELGVIALNKSAVNKNFISYLNSEFITVDQLRELASRDLVESITAKCLLESYSV